MSLLEPTLLLTSCVTQGKLPVLQHYPSPLLPPPCFSFSSVVRIKWDNVYRGLNTGPGYKWWLPPPPSPPLATSSLRGRHGDGSEEEQVLLFVSHYLVCSKGYWAPKVKMTDLNSHCRVPAQLGCEHIRESIPYGNKPTCRLQTVSTGISFFIPAWDLGGFAPLLKIDFYFFRAVLGPEQNWAEITEISHMLLAPTQTQPPHYQHSPPEGTSVTLHEPPWVIPDHPKSILYSLLLVLYVRNFNKCIMTYI